MKKVHESPNYAGWPDQRDRDEVLAENASLRETVTEQDRLLQGTIRIDRLQLADAERLRRIADAHIGHVLNDDGTCWTCAKMTREAPA